jgi:histidinol-phosphate phosphatase family protein
VKRPCVFLDRDGVINVKPPEGQYVGRWDEFRFLPGITDWIRLVNALGYLVVVVTNQRGVARGLVSPEDLDAIHARMVTELARAGARVDGVLACPHEEGACECRKPRAGMVLAAQRRWEIDMNRSLLVGDSERDLQLAQACGLPFVRVEGGRIRECIPAARQAEALE